MASASGLSALLQPSGRRYSSDIFVPPRPSSARLQQSSLCSSSGKANKGGSACARTKAVDADEASNNGMSFADALLESALASYGPAPPPSHTNTTNASTSSSSSSSGSGNKSARRAPQSSEARTSGTADSAAAALDAVIGDELLSELRPQSHGRKLHNSSNDDEDDADNDDANSSSAQKSYLPAAVQLERNRAFSRLPVPSHSHLSHGHGPSRSLRHNQEEDDDEDRARAAA